jgi:hypothetical protein
MHANRVTPDLIQRILGKPRHGRATQCGHIRPLLPGRQVFASSRVVKSVVPIESLC